MFSAINKTFKKYFVTENGELSLTAISGALVSASTSIIVVSRLSLSFTIPPILVDFAMIIDALSVGGVIIGARRAIKENTQSVINPQ